MENIKLINFIFAVLFSVCYFYQFVYLIVPLFKKAASHKPTVLHRYAVLISARNEEAVIAQLIASIKNQDYPAELVDVFVVADNCTDRTAAVAREAGAIVWERFNKALVGKGYALDFLLSRILSEKSLGHYDAFMIFDADNILSENYITEMNKTYCDGYRIITSYRNSKNYGDNWISAGYSLWFLREAKYLNNARMLLGTSCAVSGTGFLFSSEVLEKCGGWHFFLLTEDIEFTIHNIVAGEKIGYCADAVFFDEQPVSFRQSWLQRMRWAKGYLQVFRDYGGQMARGAAHGSFACFDMVMNNVPAFLLTLGSFIANLLAALAGMAAGGSPMLLLYAVGGALGGALVATYFLGLYTTVTEWRQIHATTAQKLLYTLTFPLFMLTYIPISIDACFRKVEWKQMEHNRTTTLSDILRTGC